MILFFSSLLNDMLAILYKTQLSHQPSSFEILSYIGDFRKKYIFMLETRYVGLLFM